MPHRRLFPIEHLVADRDTQDIAEDLEVSMRTVQRWIIHGVTWRQADLIAAKVLNTHPLCAFGPEWHDAAEANPDKDDHRLQFIR